MEPIEDRIDEPFKGELNMTQRIAARNDPSNHEEGEDDEVNITGDSVEEQEISHVSRKEYLAILSVLFDYISPSSADLLEFCEQDVQSDRVRSQNDVPIAYLFSAAEPE